MQKNDFFLKSISDKALQENNYLKGSILGSRLPGVTKRAPKKEGKEKGKKRKKIKKEGKGGKERRGIKKEKR